MYLKIKKINRTCNIFKAFLIVAGKALAGCGRDSSDIDCHRGERLGRSRKAPLKKGDNCKPPSWQLRREAIQTDSPFAALLTKFLQHRLNRTNLTAL